MSDIQFSKRKIKSTKSEKNPTKQIYQFAKKKQDAKSKRLHTHLSRMYHHGSSDMSRLDKKKSNTKSLVLVFLFLLLLLIFVASAASFYIFSGNVGPKFEDEKVHLAINGPQTISTGQTVTYVIEYENKGGLELNDASITVNYPIGFVVKEIEPARYDIESNQFPLDNLQPGKKGQLKVKGILVGEPGSQKHISAKLNFQPESFQAYFDEYTSLQTEMTESLLSLDISGPDQAIINEQSTYTVSYKNTSGNDLENVRISLTIPPTFTVNSVLPTPEEEYIYDIALLESETEHEISIKGIFEVGDDEQDVFAGLHEFSVSVELKGDDDQYFIQTQQSFASEILSEGPFVNVLVNNGQNQSVNLGTLLNVTIDFENKSTQDMENVILVASLDSGFLDWASVSDPNDGFIGANIITWTKDELPVLEKLSPGEGASTSFAINVKDYSSASELTSSQLNEKIQVSARISTEDSSVSYESTPIQIGVNSQVTFNTQGRYYSQSGSAIGSGPIPPQVGQTTTYRIVWKLNTSFHDLKAATVTTRIPVDAQYVKDIQADIGSIQYDGNNRSVVWAIPDHIEKDGEYEASFEVSVNPDADDIGRTMVLIASSELIATDNITSGKISKTFNAITTNLAGDSLATGNGLVIQ